MAATTNTHLAKKDSNIGIVNEACDGEREKLSQECKDLLLSLPKEKGWQTPSFYLYQDTWYPLARIQAIIAFQKHFQAKDNDIVVATMPKSGTTWLKALTFAIVNNKRFPPSQKNHPLLISNSHDLVPSFEFRHYANNQNPDLSNLLEPRLFGTHVPFHSLPNTIKKSKCKIIYICRNPFDTFVSHWIFVNKLVPPSLPKLSREEAFERYTKGISEFGPFWTHMLGYWKESKERTSKVLFLKYEDLKRDINFHLKRVAEFLDCPFSSEEESNGLIQSIDELCSFEKMKELEANKTGKFLQNYEYKSFFRKGDIGDWVNHFSPWMVEKLSAVMDEKLGGSGLSFEGCPHR